MPTVDESIHIDAPVGKVYEFARDPENQELISSNLSRFAADNPTMDKGTRMEGTTRVAGRDVEWTAEVVERVENERVEIRSVEAPMGFHITWSYEEEDGGTRVTFHQDVDSLGGFFGQLADPIVTKMYSRDVRANLEKLKTLVESQD